MQWVFMLLRPLVETLNVVHIWLTQDDKMWCKIGNVEKEKAKN